MVSAEALEKVTPRTHSGVKAGSRGAGGWVAGRQRSWNLKVGRSLERSRRNRVSEVANTIAQETRITGGGAS